MVAIRDLSIETPNLTIDEIKEKIKEIHLKFLQPCYIKMRNIDELYSTCYFIRGDNFAKFMNQLEFEHKNDDNKWTEFYYILLGDYEECRKIMQQCILTETSNPS